MRRPILAILVAATLASATSVRAEPASTPPHSDDPKPTVDDAEPHRYSIAMLGGLGAGAGAALLVGSSFIGHSALTLYPPLGQGPTRTEDNPSGACVPCTNSQLAEIRGYYYSGLVLVGVGAVLLVADVALAIVDHNYRKEHHGRKPSDVRVSLGGPAGIGVRF